MKLIIPILFHKNLIFNYFKPYFVLTLKVNEETKSVDS